MDLRCPASGADFLNFDPQPGAGHLIMYGLRTGDARTRDEEETTGESNGGKGCGCDRGTVGGYASLSADGRDKSSVVSESEWWVLIASGVVVTMAAGVAAMAGAAEAAMSVVLFVVYVLCMGVL